MWRHSWLIKHPSSALPNRDVIKRPQHLFCSRCCFTLVIYTSIRGSNNDLLRKTTKNQFYEIKCIINETNFLSARRNWNASLDGKRKRRQHPRRIKRCTWSDAFHSVKKINEVYWLVASRKMGMGSTTRICKVAGRYRFNALSCVGETVFCCFIRACKNARFVI